MKLRRRIGLLAIMLGAGVLMTGCAGKTIAPTAPTANGAKVQASVSCDGTAPCYYYFRAYDYNAGMWRQTPVKGPFGRTNGYVTIGETMYFTTRYGGGGSVAYQMCGLGDSVKNWVCVGPNGTNSYQYFNLPLWPTQVAGATGGGGTGVAGATGGGGTGVAGATGGGATGVAGATGGGA